MEERKCPKCGDDVALVDPTDENFGLDPEDFDEDAEVWVCISCDWNEEADPDEALQFHMDSVEWLLQRLAEADQ